jgi:hypothetical protein
VTATPGDAARAYGRSRRSQLDTSRRRYTLGGYGTRRGRARRPSRDEPLQLRDEGQQIEFGPLGGGLRVRTPPSTGVVASLVGGIRRASDDGQPTLADPEWRLGHGYRPAAIRARTAR